MSGLVNNLMNLERKVDPLAPTLQNIVRGKPAYGKYYGESPPPPPGPPSQDTAANAAQQQMDLMRRRRGVYGNIFGGATGGVPQTSSKSQLGS